MSAVVNQFERHCLAAAALACACLQAAQADCQVNNTSAIATYELQHQQCTPLTLLLPSNTIRSLCMLVLASICVTPAPFCLHLHPAVALRSWLVSVPARWVVDV
jgi:hypothetical protein